jgi:DNA-binding CsgD family transcriptional regulator/tetratricopeptide (TPR) repeat protein
MADVPRLGSGIPLVARRGELATLEAALRAARDGQAGAVLVFGDAGVGKSRLLTELCERARAAGDVVLSGGCLDAAEASLPYLPFVEALRQFTEQRPELIDNHPALARLLPGAHRPAASVQHDRDLGQLQLFDALLSAITELAAEHTVLLTIEDLHWADRSSRDLLAFLLSRLSTQKLLVVGTLRSDDLHRKHPLRPLLAELVRLPAVERLSLEPFTAADAEAFVRRLADDSVGDELVRDIAARSEGNAFIAEELVSACCDDMPHELAEIMLARVEGLTPAAQQVIRLASVLGRRFTHPRIGAASRLDDEQLEQALREAVAHHVLVTEDAYTYAFRHALLREAVYGDLLPGERTRLHARVADVLASDHADASGPSGQNSQNGQRSQGLAAELAHHRMESHDLPGALQASWLAATEADELQAPAEALLHAERALTLWHAVPDPERVSGTDELAVTRFAAWAASASGEPDRALAHSRSAATLADATGDDLVAADVRRWYALYLLDHTGMAQQSYDTAMRAWHLVADAEPSAVKAWVQAVVARAAASLDRYEEAIAFGFDAQRTAQAIDAGGAGTGAGEHTAAEVDALVSIAACVGRLGDQEQALRQLAAATELAATIGAVGVELRARWRMTLIQLESGRLPPTLAEVDAAVRHAESTGLTWSTWGLELRVLQVVSRFMAGDWDGAERAAELAGESVSGTVATRVSAASLLVAVGRGRFDAAQRRLTQLRERWRTDTQVMRLLGQCGAELELWRAHPSEAIQWIEQALQWLRHAEPWHLGEVSLCAVGVAGYADLAEQARRSRDQTAEDAENAAVRAGLALARRAADAMVNGKPQAGEIGPEALAWKLRVDAETARLRGDHDPARWRAVHDAFGYGEPYRQAYASWRCAEALLAGGAAAVAGREQAAGPSGSREEAAEQLRAAAAIADRLGAAPLRAAVAKLARRGRILLAGDGELPPDTLTQREHSVLTLVADGRTNRQIGQELFISEKTVSVHLSRVMAKLGAGSRTEAVSAAFARGLLAAGRPAQR